MGLGFVGESRLWGQSPPMARGHPDLSPLSAHTQSSPEMQRRQHPRRQPFKPGAGVPASCPAVGEFGAQSTGLLGPLQQAPAQPPNTSFTGSPLLLLPGVTPNKQSTPTSLPRLLFLGNPTEEGEHTPSHPTPTRSTLLPAKS